MDATVGMGGGAGHTWGHSWSPVTPLGLDGGPLRTHVNNSGRQEEINVSGTLRACEAAAILSSVSSGVPPGRVNRDVWTSVRV